MAFTLPLPVRVAAGIVATGIQVVRALPEEIPAIPVTLAGNAMRLSMKVQQEITTLATRGDELIGNLTGRRPVDNPSWATFDEDTEPARPPMPPAATAAKPKARPTSHRATPGPATGSGHRHEPAASSLPDPDSTAMQAAADVGEAVVDLATHAGPREPAGPPTTEPDESTSDPSRSPAGTAGTAGTAEPPPAPSDAAQPDSPDPATSTDAAQPDSPDPATSTEASQPDAAQPEATGGEPASPRGDADGISSPSADPTDVGEVTNGPAALPGYDEMTLAQVRGHLRDLSAAQVSTLLDYEQSGGNRAPFLTLLSNRLVTLGTPES